MADTTPPLPPAPPAPPASAVRTCLRLLLPLAVMLGLLVAALGGVAGAVRWMVASPAGSAWLLGHLPMVQTQGFEGALLGDTWRADQVRLSWASGQQWVLIEGLQANGLRWQWRPDANAWLGVQAKELKARRVTVHTGEPSGKPPTLPARIAPPLRLEVARTEIDELTIARLAPWHSVLALDLALDPGPQGRYSARQLGFEGFGLTVVGRAAVGVVAPLDLDIDATARPTLDGEVPRWAAALQAKGNVPRITLSGTLRGRAANGPDAPSADVQAVVQPFLGWPLTALSLQTQALDLAALVPAAPRTRLAGHAELKGGADGAPLVARVQLTNSEPGRWNEKRLPIQGITAEVQGQVQQRDRLEVPNFELILADGTRQAGRWSGNAAWQGTTLTLATQLAGVMPQRRDGRSAAMTLGGPLALTVQGLPSPDTRAAAPAKPPPALRADWKLDLQGKLDAAPQPVRLQLEGGADAQKIDILRAVAESGSARAELQASVVRLPATGKGPASAVAAASPGDWQVQTEGSLRDFDPLRWWPGESSSALRQGPHRLSGDWRFEVRLPGDAARLAPLALAQRLAGNGVLHVRDSQLSGVPVSAEFTLGYKPAAAAATLHADILLGGNQILVDGRGDPAGRGESDHWHAELKAESLTALAPLVRLEPSLADWLPRGGSAVGTMSAQGRWPALQTDGDVQISQLKVGKLALARGVLGWKLDSRSGQRVDQPLSLHLELAGLQLNAQRADNLHMDLQGTLADHRIDISGALPVKPPPLVEQVLGIDAQSGTRLQLKAQGAWQPLPAGGGRWRARVETLQAGSWDGTQDAQASASGWAEARDLRADVQFDAKGAPVSVQADPGRIRLADALTLRWDAVRWDLSGEQAQLQLHADIDAFALAPLLARAQPGMGWQGDLRLAARVDIRAGEKLDADLVFERRDGDLSVTSGDSSQPMGLSEFKLSLAAHQGVWNFTQSFRGSSLGEITGQLRAQTTPERRWPDPEAPIEGAIQARVADIGIWSAWVPPGWRLIGELRTTARVGGRFGEPQFTGDLTGSGLGVRNLLQGVNISDGQIAVKLAGDSAQIERFSFKGGEGTLSVTGGATLGSQPQARVQIVAQHFRLLGRIDRQAIVSGNAELDLQPEAGRLEGRFKLDEGLIDARSSGTPTLDDDVTVRRPGIEEERRGAATAQATRRNFTLALDLDMGEQLRVRGRGLDTLLKGQLHITNPAGKLAVNGTINTEGGTYAAYGQKLDIERGIIAFSGAADNPRLDVLALRPNIDTRVGVQITGNLLTLRVRLFSEPDMADTDKLAWLVLGRAPDGLGRNDTALLQRAAVALLSGEGEAPTDALLKSLGIDELSLRQGDTDVRETVVTLGKQLSRRWYLGYERGVNATTGTWQLIYRIAQRFTLRAQSGLDNSLDIIWTWRFQETPTDAGMRKSTIVPP